MHRIISEDIPQLSRPTVYNYRKQGRLKATLLPNNRWDYDTESAYLLLNKDVPRRVYAYARVSTNKQKKDLKS